MHIGGKAAGVTGPVMRLVFFMLEQTESTEFVVQSAPADAQYRGGFHFGAADRSQSHFDKFFFDLGESHTQLNARLSKGKLLP